LASALFAAIPPSAGTPAAFGVGLAWSQDAGYLADVEDRKLSVTYSTLENRTDVALALAPLSPDGPAGITLVFRARFEGSVVDAERLAELVVRAHYRVHSSELERPVQALTETHAMRIQVDPGDPSGITLFFFPTNWGYVGYSAPGDEIPVAWFTVSPADLRAIAVARSLAGTALWTDFTMTAEQLDSLREFVRLVLPPSTL
jgi:hypothetical protein